MYSYYAFEKYLRKMGKYTMLQRQLSVDFKKGCVSVCFSVFHIVIEFDVLTDNS